VKNYKPTNMTAKMIKGARNLEKKGGVHED
jgi:hypothetical protein